MQFLKKFRDIFLALLPIMVIVLFVHFFFYKFDTGVLIRFFVSAILICLGEVLFLTGVDSTIMPMGDLMIGCVNKASKLVIFVMFAIIFGFCATIAEPDVTVFSNQVISSGLNVSKTVLIFCIGAGVGLLVALGVVRIVKNIKIKYIYLALFAIIFVLCTQVKSEHIAIAFDAGGATTGIVTAPFLLAISSGLTAKFSKDSNKEVFGMVGLASLGPIIAVLLFFTFAGGGTVESITESSDSLLFISVLMNASLAIIPIAVVFCIYDLIFIKLPLRRKFDFVIGLVITFVGLFLFLFGIDFGIADMGYAIGDFISGLSLPLIIVFCIALGFIITFSEPSVIVLSRQVQTSTKNNIPYIVVMLAIAVAMAGAIMLSALKIIFDINFFYIILVGYLIALILMFFVPDIFTNLAFDSGGVASGPMSSAFLLPIMIALASQTSSAVDGFGLIGIVGMCPIVVIQVLGLVYRINVARTERSAHKKAIRVTYGIDMYSNIEKLEAHHNKLMKEKGNERKI